jgi:hypothetical protein
MAERLNVAVSKTVEGNTSGGSNPSLSASHIQCPRLTAGHCRFRSVVELCSNKSAENDNESER